MQYRRLGKSGLEVSVVGLGGNNFGPRADERTSAAVIRQAVDLGVNLIDTADIYGQGTSEEYVGRAVKGIRQQVLIATKVSGRMGEGPNRAGTSRQRVMDGVEASLRRLGTDYIDLYQVHFPDPQTPIEETLRALDDLVHQGKVHYLGSSNFSGWQIVEAAWTTRTLGLNPLVSAQNHYNLLHREVEREVLPACQAYEVGLIPYFPLASGFLTGKYRKGAPLPQGTRGAGSPSFQERMLTDRNFGLLERLETFAAARGHTVLELAFAWLLANPQVSSVIAGATRPEQVLANAAAADWVLSPEEAQEVSQITQG